MGQQQPNGSCALIDDRAWIATSVGAVLPDDLRFAPGLATVAAATKQQMNFAGVAAAVLAPLAEGEKDAVLGGDEGRDAITVVAVLAGGEEGRLVELARTAPAARNMQRTAEKAAER
jgi:hypothetical protein